ncbi:MAG: transposase [Candidatus Methanofastidiosia archaeon]
MDIRDEDNTSKWTFPLDWNAYYGGFDNKGSVEKQIANTNRTYKRNWSEYNTRQMLEQLHVNNYLSYFLDQLPPEPSGANGRPRTPLRDIIQIGINIQYTSISTRRIYSYSEFLSSLGYITAPCHFNTISKYIRDKDITPRLERVIQLSAKPLAVFEETLALDATGISKHYFSRWQDDKKDFGGKQRDYLKLHVISGTKTGSILSAIVTPSNVADITQFESLTLTASSMAKIQKVVADKAYLSRKNIDLVFALGGIPLIPFKSICTANRRGSPNWKKMYHFYHEHQDLFMQHYHQRSNVESVFSTMKRVTKRKLFSKSFEGQKNEVLLKCLVHNLRVLSRELIVMDTMSKHRSDDSLSCICT